MVQLFKDPPKLVIPGHNMEVPWPLWKKEAFDRLCKHKTKDTRVIQHFDYWYTYDKEYRTAAMTGNMINKAKEKRVVRSGDWTYDEKIEREVQVGEELFKKGDNVYTYIDEHGKKRKRKFDRGHWIRRRDVCYGDTLSEAEKKSRGTYIYPNAGAQFHDINTDEWLDEENFIAKRHPQSYIFTGPKLEKYFEHILPDGSPYWIPALMFKVVSYPKDGKLYQTIIVVAQVDYTVDMPGTGSLDLKLGDRAQLPMSWTWELIGKDFLCDNDGLSKAQTGLSASSKTEPIVVKNPYGFCW